MTEPGHTPPQGAQTICLSMIVKNEAHVIRRCLDSVRPLIDSWVIVDTGSTDGTQQVIREHMRDLPGELFERPWVDLGFNRTEALALAQPRADYLFVIDADEVLEFEPGFVRPHLTADAYWFPMQSGDYSYYKMQLIRAALPWSFRGVMHEHLYCDQPCSAERMTGLRNLRRQQGARSLDPLTPRRDALLLEGSLLAEPDNPRHMFYLAQSYADAREYDAALDRYTRRVALGGWHEEVWYSLFQIAGLLETKGAPWPQVLEAYLAAYNFRTDRAEPLYRIGLHYQSLSQYKLAEFFLSRAIEIPYPEADMLYVNREIYEILLPLEFSVNCFYVGRHQEAIETANRLLEDPRLSPQMREQVLRNRQFSLDAMQGVRGGTSVQTEPSARS